jgi:formylglycine-generating enzyme required for sulfatase activity
MVWIPGGSFRMGSDCHYPEEAPVHSVEVGGFWMDRYLITNSVFAGFIKATGYVTAAEKIPPSADYPGALPEMLVAGSVVFVQPRQRVDLRNHFNWWNWIPGADWRHPEGPESSLLGRDWHPVVHVTYEDAAAYAAWAGKTLPTEAEWEFACRGGLDGAEFAWGSELTPRGKQMANTWQGEFPVQNLCLDGYERTSPVRAFPPNGYGLFDMIGNVWEWTEDWFQEHKRAAEHHEACCSPDAPIKPSDTGADGSMDPRRSGASIPRKVLKGGSHLCAQNYCRRYRPAARMAHDVDTSTSHVGFRCIRRGATAPG